MIKFTVDGNNVSVEADGGRLDVLAEAVMAFMTLAEAVAPAGGLSFDSTALMLYQQGVAAYKKKEEFERGKKA